MKRIKWIWILGAILCVGCGSQAGKEPAQTSTPSPTPTEQPYVEPTAPPGAATQAVEKRNVTIQGHSYKYIFYTEYDDSLAVLAAGTDEKTLYIPSEIEGKEVPRVGKSDEWSEMAFRFEPVINGVKVLNYAGRWEATKDAERKNLVIPEGIEIIYNDTFEECYFNDIELPSTLEDIQSLAFGFSHIREVTVKSKEINIGRGAFLQSTLRKIQFPKGYKGVIERDAFEQTELESFDWPDYNDAIENGEIDMSWKDPQFPSFKRCKNLKEVRFPEKQKLIYINSKAFLGCPKLTKLTFPASTKKVVYGDNYYARNYKKSPAELVFLGKDTELKPGSESYYLKDGDDDNKHWIISVGKIVAPRNSKAIQKAKNVWKIKKLTYGQMDELNGEYENEQGSANEFHGGQTDVDSEGISYEKMEYQYLN